MPKRVDSKRIDLTGKQFGDLKVIRLSDKRGKNNTLLWECKCSCGEIIYLLGTSLMHGHYKSCGCKRVKKRDAGLRKHIKKDTVSGTRKSSLKSKLHKENKSGHKGVMWMKHRKKWKAYIGFKGKQISLGHYNTLEDAVAARKAGELKYHRSILDRNEYGRLDLTGHQYGRLKVLHEGEKKGKERGWVCECECGKILTVAQVSLRTGNTQSCGCLVSDNSGRTGRYPKKKIEEVLKKMISENDGKPPKSKDLTKQGLYFNTVTKYFGADTLRDVWIKLGVDPNFISPPKKNKGPKIDRVKYSKEYFLRELSALMRDNNGRPLTIKQLANKRIYIDTLFNHLETKSIKGVWEQVREYNKGEMKNDERN